MPSYGQQIVVPPLQVGPPYFDLILNCCSLYNSKKWAAIPFRSPAPEISCIFRASPVDLLGRKPFRMQGRQHEASLLFWYENQWSLQMCLPQTRLVPIFWNNFSLLSLAEQQRGCYSIQGKGKLAFRKGLNPEVPAHALLFKFVCASLWVSLTAGSLSNFHGCQIQACFIQRDVLFHDYCSKVRVSTQALQGLRPWVILSRGQESNADHLVSTGKPRQRVRSVHYYEVMKLVIPLLSLQF